MTRSDLASVGEHLAKIGRHAEAGRIFHKALALDPQDAVAACGLAMLHLQRGELAQAVLLARQARGLSPFDMRSTILARRLGAALCQAGEADEARYWLTLYLDKAPWDVEAQAALARMP